MLDLRVLCGGMIDCFIELNRLIQNKKCEYEYQINIASHVGENVWLWSINKWVDWYTQEIGKYVHLSFNFSKKFNLEYW